MHNLDPRSRPQYTEADIRSFSSNELPGFSREANTWQLFDDVDTSMWQPVLSTTIVTTLANDLHVLTGKRTSAGNTTHVNVASTPTVRVPVHEAKFLLAERVDFNLQSTIDPLRPFVSESLPPSVARIPNNMDTLSSKVCYLLALKLQLGPALELAQNRQVGRASLARYTVGFSYLEDTPQGEPLFEPLIMLGTIVELHSEIARQIPAKTPSYDNLGWTPIDQYTHGVVTKNLLEIIPTASLEDEIEVCVRGLCNATSWAILNDESEIQSHLTEGGLAPWF